MTVIVTGVLFYFISFYSVLTGRQLKFAVGNVAIDFRLCDAGTYNTQSEERFTSSPARRVSPAARCRLLIVAVTRMEQCVPESWAAVETSSAAF